MGIFGKIGRAFSGLPVATGRGAGKLKAGLSGLVARPGEEAQIKGIQNHAEQAGQFAGQGEAGYAAGGAALDAETGYMRDIARGNQSVSAEQLRQGLQQNLAAQQSMAAGAAPRDQGMAALMASRNAMSLGSGLAGQQALAGMQERQNAQQALARMLLEKRQQDMQVGLGGRQTAVQGYGNLQPGQSTMDKWAGPIMGGLKMLAGG